MNLAAPGFQRVKIVRINDPLRTTQCITNIQENYGSECLLAFTCLLFEL